MSFIYIHNLSDKNYLSRKYFQTGYLNYLQDCFYMSEKCYCEFCFNLISLVNNMYEDDI